MQASQVAVTVTYTWFLYAHILGQIERYRRALFLAFYVFLASFSVQPTQCLFCIIKKKKLSIQIIICMSSIMAMLEALKLSGQP